MIKRLFFSKIVNFYIFHAKITFFFCYFMILDVSTSIIYANAIPLLVFFFATFVLILIYRLIFFNI